MNLIMKNEAKKIRQTNEFFFSERTSDIDSSKWIERHSVAFMYDIDFRSL